MARQWRSRRADRGPRQEIEVLLSPEEERSCDVAPGAVEIDFAPDLKGFGWCFRKGPYLNVGYGRQDARAAATHAREFAGRLRRLRRLPESALAHWQGHAYLLYPDRVRALVDDGVLLVGDAAGLAYAQSGEGIRTAVESGLIAAHTIMDADGDYEREHLEAYAARLDARFGRPGISRFLPESWTIHWALACSAAVGSRATWSSIAGSSIVISRRSSPEEAS